MTDVLDLRAAESFFVSDRGDDTRMLSLEYSSSLRARPAASRLVMSSGGIAWVVCVNRSGDGRSTVRVPAVDRA